MQVIRKVLISGMLCAISILFVGYSLLSGTNEGNVVESYQNILESTTGKEIPGYYELNDNSKYENLTAKHAFKFADTYSEETKDIASLEIGTLLDGEIFLYDYSTRVKEDSSDDTRAYVRRVAAYQYDTGSLRVIHENKYSHAKIAEDGKSLYLQIYDWEGNSDPSIFVYDNRIGYLYKLDGTLEFSMDIEGYVRSHFNKAYSVSVTSTLTDGADRTYAELTIEKTAIDLGEVMEENETMSKKDADEATEELEKETADKTVELVLLHDFTEPDSDTTINQTDAALDDQTKTRQNMTKGKACTARPGTRANWVTANTRVPSQWKITFFDYITMDSKAKSWLDPNRVDYSSVSSGDMPTLTWENEPKSRSFNSEGYVCNSSPKQETYQGSTDLKIKTKPENVFIPLNGEYYEVYGATGDKMNYYDSATATRSYTYEYGTTTTDQNGSKIQEASTETRTQGFTVHRKRYIRVAAPCLEGYGTLRSLGIGHVDGVADNQVLCQKGKQLYQLKRDKTLTSAKISIGGDYLLDLAEDGERFYYLVSTSKNLVIVEQNNGSTRKRLIEDEKLNMDEVDLCETSSATDRAYMTAFDHTMSGQSPWVQITSHQFQKTSIQVDNSVLQQLSAQGVGTSRYRVEGEGFLLTTFQNGLPYYGLDAGLVVNLDVETWYGTWRKGNKFISIGFENKDTLYSTLDVAFARVKEYGLNEFHRESLKNLLANAKSRNEQLKVKRAQEVQESIAISAVIEKNKEAAEDMMDTWETRTAGTDAGVLESGIQELID